MIYTALADGVVAFHAVFIVFGLLGASLLVRFPRLIWLHLPVLAWGTWIEFSGNYCPLTPLENDLRDRAGLQGYTGGFIDHYLTPVIYPDGLTRGTQAIFGSILLALNLAFYARFLLRRRAA